jgi:hypothetical protein
MSKLLYSAILIFAKMDDSITTGPNNDENQTAPEEVAESVGRRDFLKLAAILTGSTLLLLSRCGGLEFPEPFPDEESLPIPPNFKRFILVESEQQATDTVQRIVAFGSQCPDLACALLWIDQPDFEFYDRVEQIVNRYTRDGRIELVWLD